MFLVCTCFRLRRLSRQVTQRHDDALRPVGLWVTQFNLKSAVRNKDSMTVAITADGLALLEKARLHWRRAESEIAESLMQMCRERLMHTLMHYLEGLRKNDDDIK